MIATAEDPGRLGITAYTYFHIPMVAGIVAAAAGVEIALAHPQDDVDAAGGALILGGPILFLAGHLLFKRAIWGTVPLYEVLAVLALVALVPAALVSSVLMLLGAATAVGVTVAWRATRAVHADLAGVAPVDVPVP